MTGLDTSRLSPGDAIAALRSYPRRFRAAVLPIDDDPEVEQLAEAVGPDGRSALEHVVAVTNTWVLLARSLERVVIEDEPDLDRAVVDPARREWELPPGTTVEGALERLRDEADALAERAAHTQPPDWRRTGRVVGAGEAVTALDLLHEAVRAGADGLRAAERAIEAQA